MTTRRTFIKTLAAVPPALYFRPAWPAADPSRLALVIGNSSYQDAPLVNPANDARAISNLFSQAGFTVDSRLDARRSDMMAAIERFGVAAKRSDTRLVVFYYAGHGAQLDWRNYLLPVDAVVQKQADLKERCVDLSLLLGQLSAAKDKTFIIILDACRNNPFGSAYRPEQKGLSQFDAPVGSLLAYATAPGNVASDGDGQNGLYTENLVRELSRRGTRIEDALKRVRLNVRLASRGEQIPWETTSLEDDVFIFDGGQKKLSENELEQMAEADIAEWTRIKSSKKTEDWVAYLRSFPNGRFAEIAQMRLTRQLAEIERLAAEERQREELRRQEEQRRLAEQKRLEQERLERERVERERAEQERIERERLRLAEEQRLAAEREQRERQQAELRRRQAEQQSLEARRQLEREQLRIAEAERLAVEQRRQQEQQRQLAEQKQLEERKLAHERQDRLDAERRADEERRRAERNTPAQTKADPAAAVKPAAPRPAAAQPIEIREGVAVPQLIAPSVNPYSAGRYPLNRIFSVGDSATMRISDLLTGIEEQTRTLHVTRVDYDEDRVEYNQRMMITDLMGNPIKMGRAEYDAPVQFTPTEFQVGKKWTAAFHRTQNGKTSNAYFDLHIARRETVSVPAGSFDCFRIEGTGWNLTLGQQLEIRMWLVPGINFIIRREQTVRSRKNQFRQAEKQELVALRQQNFVSA
jgi:uncharacterized caspase-like protein